MERVERSINGKDIKIIIGSGLENEINRAMENYSKNISFVSRILKEKYRNKINAIYSNKYFIMDGEKSKSLRYFNIVIKKLLTAEIERNNSVSYIGGGTIGDLIGYAASVYKRGVNLTAIPTTLLASVDSSIGGKNALNFMDIKNAIGTFYNPDYIFDDVDFLVNSDASLLKDGVAESMKMALIKDKNFFDYLMKNTINSIHNKESLEYIISKSIKIKLDVISQDFFDLKKLRYLLNFGHSIGHALESYSDNRISHGTAVANGMVLESYISYRSGFSDPFYDTIRSAISGYGIPVIDFKSIETEKLLSYIKNDKKVEGKKLNMVMLEERGKAEISEIDFQQLSNYINDYRART
ncbi:3-dehydroquinate synthase [Ferroplasma sp.]|uniref:3-dehydroquinate synthase n=1 Tax=Ferroplasma sp. TaxID=2591003 RepID=UPI00307F15C9